MRLYRRALFLLPTLSTGLIRLVQLAVLLILSNIATGEERNLLVAGFGLLSTFAMLTDSGAGNYLLSTAPGRISRAVYRKAVVFHLGLAAFGSILALAFVSVPAGGVIPSDTLLILVGLAITQCIDSTSRIIRTPAMVAKKDAAYAAPDLILLLLKLPVLAAVVLSSDLRYLLLLPIPSLLVAVAAYATIGRDVPVRSADREPIYRRILEFGTTGALSALYSQAPLLIATTFLPLAQLATLTIVYRIVQALDLLPGTLSLQLIPRVRARSNGPLYYWTTFFLGGAVISAALLVAMPVIETLFGQAFTDVWVFILVALSFAPKSGNYAFVAYLMGSGHIRLRLILTVGASVLAVILAVALVNVWGVIGLAAVTLVLEFLFALAGFLALNSRRSASPAPVTRVPASTS